MAERKIVIEPLQKGFNLSLKDANRQKRNRSYVNASNCCGVKLKQEKFCSACNEKVGYGDCQRKIVKIGKEEHLIEASALKQATDALEAMEDMQLHTFLKQRPTDAEDRFEALVYAYPAKKQEAQYAELVAILKGRTAIGKAVFRGNEFQILVEVGDDNRIRIRKLVDEDQRYEMQELQLDNAPNEQIVELERTILDKATKDDYNVKQFKDTRAEIEEKVIEDFVLNGTIPEVKKEVAQAQENDELARLKALAGE